MRDLSLALAMAAAVVWKAVVLSFSLVISSAAAQSLPGEGADLAAALSAPSGRSGRATQISRSPCLDLLDNFPVSLARAERLWSKDEYEEWEDHPASWRRIRKPVLTATATFSASLRSWQIPDPRGQNWGWIYGEEGEDFDCGKYLDRGFGIEGATWAFTPGSVTEACADSPRLHWSAKDGKPRVAALKPLYNRNVEVLWCAGRYLVFGISHPGGEGSMGVEDLAFWDLTSGQWARFPAGWSPALPHLLPDWRCSEAAGSENAVILKSRTGVMAFWPADHTWSLWDPGSGRELPSGWAEPLSLPNAFRERPVLVMDDLANEAFQKHNKGRIFQGSTGPGKVVLGTGQDTQDFLCFCVGRAHRASTPATDSSSQGTAPYNWGCFLSALNDVNQVVTLGFIPAKSPDLKAYCIGTVAADTIAVQTAGSDCGGKIEERYYKVNAGLTTVEEVISP